MSRPRGIEARIDSTGTTRFRAYFKQDGRKVRGPWTPNLQEAIIHRNDLLGATRLEREKALGQMLYMGASKPGVQGVVYFIQAGDGGPIKIGHSRVGAESRLRVLQHGNPEELRVIGEVPGAKGSEYAFHMRLADHRIRGEWFRPHPEVLAAVGHPVGPTDSPKGQAVSGPRRDSDRT